MADEKFTGNQNVEVWFLLASAVADENAITAAEIAAGTRLTPAVAWDGLTFPAATESDDTDDRGLWDAGNATSRGAGSYEAELPFFYPKDLTDTTTEYGVVFDLFRDTRVPGYLVTRIAQTTTGTYTAAAAGQWISVYKALSTTFSADTEGDDSYKFTISFLEQGFLGVYTVVAGATLAATVAGGGTATVAVDEYLPLSATLNSVWATQSVTWSTADASVATVSPNGVVTGVGAGTVDITASHPAASADQTVSITVS